MWWVQEVHVGLLASVYALRCPALAASLRYNARYLAIYNICPALQPSQLECSMMTAGDGITRRKYCFAYDQA